MTIRLVRALQAMAMLALAVVSVGCGQTAQADRCVEGESRECQTEHGIGRTDCIRGTWSACLAGACVANAVRNCEEQRGECRGATQACEDGAWGTCSRLPSEEVCDAKDNDCDGDIDEGCDCRDGATLDCGSDLGLCEHGVQTCNGGQWGNCEGDVGPESERCDGEDNDCDGDIDEGCDCETGTEQDCGTSLGTCELGMQRCQNGRWGDCVDDVGPESEVCDSEDNDCDGDTDEGCDCRNGAMRWCEAGEGVCQSGQQTCDDGSWSACTPVDERQDELCDGLDNDCDGDEDEGFDLEVPCPVGGCPQSRICSGDQRSGVCVDDERLLAAERCDGVDNDCDGLLDRVTENGSVRSICECESRTLSIGRAVNASIDGDVNLCAPTQCGGDRPRGLLVDAICWPACQTNSDPDGDGWGFESGRSCLMENSTRGRTAAPCDGVPIGMAMTYCLNCASDPLPFAMCQSLPQFDLRAFGRGEKWLKVDYTYTSTAAARVPINLWFHTGDGRRKRLPLVKIGDIPKRDEVLLRVEDACFTPSSLFGSECSDQGQSCSQCGPNEICGALDACGDYDLSQAWLQIAAEFCEVGIGRQAGTLTVHSVDAVEPNCGQ